MGENKELIFQRKTSPLVTTAGPSSFYYHVGSASIVVNPPDKPKQISRKPEAVAVAANSKTPGGITKQTKNTPHPQTIK